MATRRRQTRQSQEEVEGGGGFVPDPEDLDLGAEVEVGGSPSSSEDNYNWDKDQNVHYQDYKYYMEKDKMQNWGRNYWTIHPKTVFNLKELEEMFQEYKKKQEQLEQERRRKREQGEREEEDKDNEEEAEEEEIQLIDLEQDEEDKDKDKDTNKRRKKKTKVQGDGRFKFCPWCGNLLQVWEKFRKHGDWKLKCFSCPYLRPVLKRTHHLFYKDPYPEAEDPQILEAKKANEHRQKTDILCPKCTWNQAYFYQMQTRSADEPMTTFYECTNPQCKHHWRE